MEHGHLGVDDEGDGGDVAVVEGVLLEEFEDLQGLEDDLEGEEGNGLPRRLGFPRGPSRRRLGRRATRTCSTRRRGRCA